MTAGSVALTRGLDRALPRHVWRYVWILMALLAVAIVTRAGRIGDPSIFIDEEFYLLVGDRMWHGAIPYVDIWDRKPILLFLIYAGLRPFSADGIVAYQIGALVFATATAFFITLIAERFANPAGALFAGIAYLMYLPIVGGGGGQAPVFYNLFLAIGAWEVIRADESEDPARIWRCGLHSMLWAGLAIQVKYTAAIEGVGFGLWLIWLLIRNGGTASYIALRAAAWVAVALAPTLLAAGVYALIGHGHEFLDANVFSNFHKHQPESFPAGTFLAASGRDIEPLLALTAFAIAFLMNRKMMVRPAPFVLMWAVCAIIDFFALGNYYDHYTLPFLAPAMIICAPLLGTLIGGVVGMAILAYVSGLFFGYPANSYTPFDQQAISRMVELAKPYAAQGCIYMFDGPPIVYLLTHSCLPTSYAFPGHLSETAEAGAVDATRNMAQLLAGRPSAIFVPDLPTLQSRNETTLTMLNKVLASDYTRIATLQDVYPERRQFFYARNDLLPAPRASH